MKNNSTNKLAILFFIMMFLQSCVINVAVDYNEEQSFKSLKTFQIVNPKAIKTDDPRLNSPLVIKRFNKAINFHLFKRNYHAKKSDPDFYITYQLQSKQEISSTNSGFSVGLGHGYHRGGIGMIYSFPENDVYSYDKAIVTIDILDQEKQLLWRGSTGYILDNASTPQKSEQAIQKIVSDILGQFPPK